MILSNCFIHLFFPKCKPSFFKMYYITLKTYFKMYLLISLYYIFTLVVLLYLLPICVLLLFILLRLNKIQSINQLKISRQLFGALYKTPLITLRLVLNIALSASMKTDTNCFLLNLRSCLSTNLMCFLIYKLTPPPLRLVLTS